MPEKQRILIIDTDSKLTSQISDALTRENYEALVVNDLTSNIDPCEFFRPDLIVFDPIIRGSDPYQRLQKFWNTYRVPTLVISKKDGVISKVISLEMGADDYLVKPFDMREFVARIRALLRRSFLIMRTLRTAVDVVEYPGLRISLNNYSVYYQDQKIAMPPKEIELLYFLACSPNQVFTRDQLLSHIWGYDYAGDTRTVDVHIKRLRRKLPATDAWSIATVWGIGYKFQVNS